MKTFQEYLEEKSLQEGWFGQKIGQTLGYAVPMAVGGALSQGGMEMMGAPADSSLSGPGYFGGGLLSKVTKFPSLLGTLVSNLEDGFYNLFKRKKSNPDQSYINHVELQLNNQSAANFKSDLEKLKKLIPTAPILDKIPAEKRELAFRLWISKTPYYENKDMLDKIWRTVSNAIHHAKKIEFYDAIPNLQLIADAIEHRLKSLTVAIAQPKLEPKEKPLPTDKVLLQGDKELFVLKQLRTQKSDADIIANIIDRYSLKQAAAKTLLTKVRNRAIQT